MDYKEEIARLQKIVEGLVGSMCWVINRVEENTCLQGDEVLIPINSAKYELECLIDSYKMEQSKGE